MDGSHHSTAGSWAAKARVTVGVNSAPWSLGERCHTDFRQKWVEWRTGWMYMPGFKVLVSLVVSGRCGR